MRRLRLFAALWALEILLLPASLLRAQAPPQSPQGNAPYGTPNFQQAYVMGVPVTNAVGNTTALRGQPTTSFPNGVWRLSDGPAGASPLFFMPGAACPTDDGSVCVASGDGLSWRGQFPRGEVDPAQSSAVADTTGTVDSTAVFAAIDANLPGGYQLACNRSLTYTVNKLQLKNVRSITNCNFKTLLSGGPSDYTMLYTGTGDLVIEHTTVTCPIYNPATQAALPTGYVGFEIEPPAGTLTASVRVLHTRFTGCNSQFIAEQTRDLYIDDMTNDRPLGFGWIVTAYNDTLGGGGTQHIRIRNTRGYAPGQYCGSLPANLNIGTAQFTPRDIDVRGVHCEAAGFYAVSGYNDKTCYDLTGTNIDQAYFEGDGYNCLGGGIENKRTTENTTAIPNLFANVHVDFRYYTNLDFGVGCMFPYEQPGTAPDERINLTGTCETKFTMPTPWQPSASYHVGDSVANSGNTYVAMTPGISAASGGPSGTGTGIADGTVAWAYAQATPASLAAVDNLVGCSVEAVTGMDFNCIDQNTAYGYSLLTRGSSDKTLRRLNLRFSGLVARSCLDLNSGVSGGTIDRLRLVNWACRTTGSSPPIYFFVADTLTNFEIVGGSFINDPASCASGAFGAFRNDAATVTGTITGAPRFVGCNAAFYMSGGTTNLVWSGGGTAEVTYASGGRPIQFAGTSLGNITVTTPIYVPSAVAINAANYPTWSVTSTGTPAPSVYGRFNRYFASAAPINTTDPCVAGDEVLAITPAAGVPNGWFCSAANTWTAF